MGYSLATLYKARTVYTRVVDSVSENPDQHQATSGVRSAETGVRVEPRSAVVGDLQYLLLVPDCVNSLNSQLSVCVRIR